MILFSDQGGNRSIIWATVLEFFLMNKKKKKSISEDEIVEFHKAVGGSTPVKYTERNPTKKPIKKRKPEPAYKEQSHHIAGHENIDTKDRISGDDTMQHSKSGIQHRLLQKLKRGQIDIEASLDLHGYTVSEAAAALEDFIADCQAQHMRRSMIIHGKGRFSGNDAPILKNQVNQWLRRHSQVLAFHSAQAKDGGTGAVYLLLKMKP